MPLSLAKFGAQVGYSPRQLRNLIKQGLPTLDTKPIKVDETAARAWIDAHAQRATPGPGRPRGNSHKTSGEQPVASGQKPAVPSRKPEQSPLFVEHPLQSLVLSGAGTPADILRLAALTPDKGGISRAHAENLKTIAAASSAVMDLRKNSGQLLDAASVRVTWERFFTQLVAALERLPARTADRLLAAMRLPPKDKDRITKVIAAEIEDLKAQLIAPTGAQGDTDEQEA